MKRIVALLFALGVLLPCRVWAWDTITSGRVSVIQVNPTGSFGLQLQGVNRLCSVTPDGAWAWLDGNWPGYTIEGQKSILATLEAARLSGSTVWVFADIGPDGYCRIGVVNLM